MSRDLLDPRCYFHLHTTRTDGRSSVADYMLRCRERGGRPVFLEHIRRSPSYDVEGFVREVERLGREMGVDATVGFETKLLPSAELDIREDHQRLAAVLGVAEHGFSGNADRLAQCFEEVLARLDPSVPTVWVHPGLWFQRHGLDPQESPAFRRMWRVALAGPLLIELNLEYQLPAAPLLKEVPSGRLVVGLNAHHVDELDRIENVPRG